LEKVNFLKKNERNLNVVLKSVKIDYRKTDSLSEI